MPNSIDYKDNEETASERTSRLKYLSVWEYAKGETKPIWTDNAFAGEFGDNFIQDTSLEGGHIPEAIDRLQSSVIASLPHFKKGVLKNFTSSEHQAVSKALSLLDHAKNVERKLRGGNFSTFTENKVVSKALSVFGRAKKKEKKMHPFSTFISERINEVKKMSVGSLLVWPGGWLKPGGGHAIMYVVEKTSSSKVSWITCNTGQGIQYHPKTLTHYPKQKRKLAIRIDDIPIERLANEAFIYLLFRMKAFPDKDHGDGLYYNVVLPQLIGNSRALSTAWNHDDPYGEWETPQKAGTCFFRCVLCTLKYLLRRDGMKKDSIKLFFHAVRQSFLRQALEDLKNPTFAEKPLHHSQASLLRLASKQTAYSAVKESRAGRVDMNALKEVKSMCDEIESLLGASNAVVPPTEKLPSLHLESDHSTIQHAPWHDNLLQGLVIAYQGDTDHLKGDPDPAPKILPVDYLECPTKDQIESIHKIAQVLQFLREAVDKTFLQPNKTESLYEVLSLIEHVFIRVLPCPSLSQVNDASCKWHSSRKLKNKERHSILEDLAWSSKQYTIAREKVPTHYFVEPVRIVTHSRIMLAYWAILRQGANDFSEEEEAIHTELLKFPVFLPETDAGESFDDITAKLPFVDPYVTQARAEVSAEMEKLKKSSLFASKTLLFNSMVRGSGKKMPNHDEMIQVMGQFNFLHSKRKRGQLASTTPPKRHKGKIIKMSEEERNLGWLCVFSSHETSHMPGFYGLRDMLLRYVHGVNNDMGTRKEGRRGSPSADAFTIRMGCKYDEEGKSGEIKITVCGEKRLRNKNKIPFSPANLRSYKEFRRQSKDVSEDDVLFAKALPNFDDTLSAEDSERICSYLTAPYLRIPMLLDYFANGRIGNLFNKQLRSMLFHSLFAPGNYVAGEHSEIDMIPYKAEQIGCENGILWNELEKGPQGCLDPLLKLLKQGVKQCVDDYRSTYVEVFLYFIQIAVGVQKYLLAVIEANGAAVHNDYNRRLSSYLNDDCQSVLRRLLGEAIDADDKDNMVILYAHVLMAGGNVHDPARKLNPTSLGHFVGACAFVKSWHQDGKSVGDDETLGGLCDDQLFWTIQGARRQIQQWYSSANTAEQSEMLELVVSIATCNPNIKWENTDTNDAVISASKGDKFCVNRQTMTVMFKQCGLELVPEEISGHIDFQTLYPGSVPHCAVVSRFNNRHVVVIAKDQMRIENWRRPNRTVRSIGAPFDAKAENVKEIMLETVHPYTKYEMFAANSLDRKLPAGTKGFWVRFDKSTSTYPTTVHGSSEKYVITNVAAVVSKDGKQEDFKRPKAVVLFGGPGSDAWTSEYYVKGNFFHSTYSRILDENDYASEVDPSWLYGIKLYLKPVVPTKAHELTYGGIKYSRFYQYPNVMSRGPGWNESLEDVQWVLRILEPIVDHNFSKPNTSQGNLKRRELLAKKGSQWVFIFPKERLDNESCHCRVLAFSMAAGQCNHEIHISRAFGTVDVFTINEHGRYAMPVLSYTSDARFSFSALEIETQERDFPLPSVVKYAVGDFLSDPYLQQTIVATDASGGRERVHIPSRFLFGRIPHALLENFEFWKVNGEGDVTLLEGVRRKRTRKSTNGEIIEYIDPFFDYDIEIELDSNGCVVRRINKDSTTSLLINPKIVPFNSKLERICRLLVRFESLSHVLLWSKESDGHLSIIEMPRLLSKFQLKNGKLYSLDQGGMFISDRRLSQVERFMRSLPGALLLENKIGKLCILCPNRPLMRPKIKSCPFSATTVCKWNDLEWISTCRSRTFTYELHVSGRFVLFPSVSATFYWAFCMLLGRDYENAALATDSCDTDMPLTAQQITLLKYFEYTSSDGHPDAVGCRLKLRLALIYANLPDNVLPNQSLWKDLNSYVERRSHVSSFCQISLSEEAQLLDLVTQGEDGTNMKCDRKDIVQQMLRGEDKRQEHFKLHKDNLSLKYDTYIVRKKWYISAHPNDTTNTSATKINGPKAFDILDELWNGIQEAETMCFLVHLFTGSVNFSLNASAPDAAVDFAEVLTRAFSYIDRSFASSSFGGGMANAFRAAVLNDQISVIRNDPDLKLPMAVSFNCYKPDSPYFQLVPKFQKVAFMNKKNEAERCELGLAEVYTLDCKTWKPSSIRITDYSNNEFQLKVLKSIETYIDVTDCQAFKAKPLAKVAHLEDYIDEKPIDPSSRIPNKLPFDLSGSDIVATKFGEDTVNRLAKDMQAFADETNNKKLLILKCISDSDLADYEHATNVSDGPEFAQSATIRLEELLQTLRSCKEDDEKDINAASEYLLSIVNKVDLDTESHNSERYCFSLERYAGLQPTFSWEDLVAILLSSKAKDDLLQGNPFLNSGEIKNIMIGVASVAFKTNRISHLNWAMYCAHSVIRALASKAPPKNLIKEVASLTNVLCMSRHYVEESGRFDPRFLVFEYLFGLILRKSQVYLVNTFVKRAIDGGTNVQGLQTHSMVHQMIMGAGKTTVIGPLLALLMADGNSLVTQVVPDALLEMSRSVMWNRFAQVIPKRVYTLSFGRSFPANFESVNVLRNKLVEARKNGGIVCTTPATIKSIVNRYVELLNNGNEFVLSNSLYVECLLELDVARAPKKSTYKGARIQQKAAIHAKETRAAHGLASILDMFREGVLLMDEVDMLLHPLRSELNFPIGPKYPLTPSPHRWNLAIHIIDGFLFAASSPSTIDMHTPPECLLQLKSKVAEGIAKKCIQTVPHMVLIDRDFYEKHMKEHLATWIIVWMRSKHLLGVNGDEDIRVYLMHGQVCGADICNRLEDTFEKNSAGIKEGFQMLNLGHDWLSSILPHVLGKIDRISFGLLKKRDLENMQHAQPLSRQLCAVPFIGKDVPSGAAEFAQPDCLIGSTVLAYRYEGLREQDIKRILLQLKFAVQHEPGMLSSRPSFILFENWVANACKRNHIARSVPSLDLLQPGEKKQLKACFRLLRDSAEATFYYLQTFVFPKCMQNQTLKIGSSGQELGSDILFGRRLGFSGTPSNLLPLDIQPCQFEKGSEGKVVRTLSVPSITSESPLSKDITEWNIDNFLTQIASGKPKYNALIDTGALVTGKSNFEVAEYLIKNGLSDMDGCVYLDENDCKMVYKRGAIKPVPLSECGISKSKRFTFYDQVHTTGMDIKQALSAVALLTLGKDMIFRDYAQGAYRMRGIGAGQTIHLYIIPEVKKIIQNTVPRTSGSMVVDACAWLQINGIKQEKMQFMQLCTQNTATVGRKHAMLNLMQASLEELKSCPEGKELQVFNNKNIGTALSILRETVVFDIPDTTPKKASFVDSLEQIRQKHQAMLKSQSETDTLDFVKAQAESLVRGNGEEGSIGKQLGGEMTREKEREQEQEQQRQQEQQAQISYGNPSSIVVPWSLKILGENQHGEESDGPFYKLHTFSPRPDSVSYKPPGKNAKRIVPGVKPLDYPKEMYLSSNYLDKNFDKSQLVRIRNVSIVLEWQVDNKSHYVAVSLGEAESIRRFLHSRSQLLRTLPPIALHGMESDRRFDYSENFPCNDHNDERKKRLVAFHFWDNKMFFDDDEVVQLLSTFKNQSKVERQTLFDATLLSRRRDRSSWVGTPVGRVFELDNDKEFTELLVFINSLSTVLHNKGISLLNACNEMDIDGDGFLSEHEIISKLSSLVPEASVDLIRKLVRICDRDGDGSIDYDEFSALLAVHEHGNDSAQDRLSDIVTNNDNHDSDETAEERKKKRRENARRIEANRRREAERRKQKERERKALEQAARVKREREAEEARKKEEARKLEVERLAKMRRLEKLRRIEAARKAAEEKRAREAREAAAERERTREIERKRLEERRKAEAEAERLRQIEEERKLAEDTANANAEEAERRRKELEEEQRRRREEAEAIASREAEAMRLEALEEERIREAEIARLNEERLRQEQEALRLQQLEITNQNLDIKKRSDEIARQSQEQERLKMEALEVERLHEECEAAWNAVQIENKREEEEERKEADETMKRLREENFKEEEVESKQIDDMRKKHRDKFRRLSEQHNKKFSEEAQQLENEKENNSGIRGKLGWYTKKAKYSLRKVGSSSVITLKRVGSAASIGVKRGKGVSKRNMKLCSTKFCNGLKWAVHGSRRGCRSAGAGIKNGCRWAKLFAIRFAGKLKRGCVWLGGKTKRLCVFLAAKTKRACVLLKECLRKIVESTRNRTRSQTEDASANVNPLVNDKNERDV